MGSTSYQPAVSGLSILLLFACAEILAPASSYACNTVPNNGPTVTVREVEMAAPRPLGGTITDGTYVLSATTLYLAPGVPPTPTNMPSDALGTYSMVFEFKGNTMLSVGTLNGKEKRYVTTFTTSGTTIFEKDICPLTEESNTRSFTAYERELRFYMPSQHGTLEFILTKR